MAYTKTVWKDKVVEKPNTYSVVNNPDGTITLTPSTGTVVEAGTPLSATNMNKIEDRLYGPHLIDGAAYEAWMYLNFYHSLTSEQLTAIKSNSTLLSNINNAINSSNMIFNCNLKSKGSVFKNAFDGVATFSNTHSDLVYSTNSTLPSKFIVVDNLTVNAGITVTANSTIQVIIVNNTLTLNGKITSAGLGGAGYAYDTAYGGSGGGSIIIFCNNVVGTGTIDSSGTDGSTIFHVSASFNSYGTSGSYHGFTITGGRSGDRNTPSNVGTGGTTNVTTTYSYNYCSHGLFTSPQSGAGGSLGASGSGTASGGGGGAGIMGAGASGGAGVSGVGSSGNGGGGGGFILFATPNETSQITLKASGGNGSSAQIAGSGVGGGGGGGLVISFAKIHNETINVSVGASGTVGSKTGQIAGGAGVSFQL